MYNHAPPDYDCPFCKIADGKENAQIPTKQADIFFRNMFMTAFVAAFASPKNPGHAVIIPNGHFENIYDLPYVLIYKINYLSRKIALAMKKIYQCPGISLYQHNEPAGNQEIWHYYLSIFPRYKDDNFYLSNYLSNKKRLPFPLSKRQPLVEKLRKHFKYEDD